MHEMEGKFDRVYRPSEREAKKRIEYLYPKQLSEDVIDRHLEMFADLARFVRTSGISLIVLKLPVPTYYPDLLPREEELTRRVTALLDEPVPFHDLSWIGNDERFFFDTDHLNRAGVRNLLDVRLGNIFRDHLTRIVPDGP